LKLLSEEHLEHSTIGYLNHAQVIHDAVVKEYFGQWRATGTRLWVTWVFDLSQSTKLKIYREKLRPLKQNLQNLGYHINFDPEQEKLHCQNLSGPHKGIKVMLDFLTEKSVKMILEKSCPEKELSLVWEVDGSGVGISCNKL